MPLHFAYGSNMDAAAMAARCPGARLLGRGRLPRWRFVVMASGYASVEPDPRMSVHGALWDVPLADMRALDRYEQVSQGLYQKKTIPVLREPVGASVAPVYIGAAAGDSRRAGAAWPGYLAEIVAAARALALPAAYVSYLSSLVEAQQKGPRG